MKPRKLKGVLSVLLTFVVVASLTAFALPVMADVTEPTVSLDEEDISVEDVVYTITFQITEDLAEGEFIYVRFPDDTDVSLVETAEVTVTATPGIGSVAGEVDTVAVTLDDQIVEIELASLTTIGDPLGRLAWIEVEIKDVTNPTEAGDYTLEVMTSALGDDEWVESEIYEILEPVVGGGVTVYNQSAVKVNYYGGSGALNSAITEYGDDVDYTIEVTPGTYKLSATLDITGEGLTLESTGGADVTIIDAETGSKSPAIQITADDVTFDGFTIETGGTGISISGAAADVTVQNNIVTSETCVMGIVVAGGATGATISGNELDVNSTMYLSGGSDSTLSDNTFGAGINLEGGDEDVTIEGNIITGSEYEGIHFGDGGSHTNTLVQGNTISETTKGDSIGIRVRGTAVTGLVIIGNDIIDNEGIGIVIEEWADSNVIAFNNIVDNADFAIQFADGENFDVDAIFNWWGSDTDDDDEIADMMEDLDPGDIYGIVYDPWLIDTVDAIFTGFNAAANIDELDAEDEAGVVITGLIDDDTTPDVAERIKAGAYAANPEGEDPPDPAVAYYDVYVALGDCDMVVSEVKTTMLLKLYVSGINEDMVAYAWSLTEDKWVECSDQEVSEFGGYVVVTIEDDTEPALDELGGTTFAVVQGEPEEAGVPTLESPAYGAEDVGLNPTFVWGIPDGGADEYTLQVATNQFFVDAWEKVHLTHTVWRWDIALENDTTYYWRVMAMADGGESDWAESVFTTEAAPVAPPAPPAVLYTCPTCGLSFDTPEELQDHWAAVHAPPPAPEPLPTTPSYIWVIIAVGVVLIIAVIALIVRTRRIA